MPDAPASPDFLAVFSHHADAAGAMSFERFMRLALCDERVGYYRRDQPRVGYGPGTDFFTASSSGPIFGEVVAAACASLLAPEDPQRFCFVEIGAEPGRGVLEGVAHPFGAVRTLRLGDPIELAGRLVAFSNELFDAQPCRRFRMRNGQWRELGVARRDDRLVETELATEAIPGELPADLPDGYVIDAPFAARDLAQHIARQSWTGLFVAFDYGKTWRELTEACPAGTARAYHHHTQSNDLLTRPGEQDLTCHVCWDWLETALTEHGFAAPALASQESFLVRHAASHLAAVSAAEASRYSQRKLALLQLLHPAHLGQKFQVLHALRR